MPRHECCWAPIFLCFVLIMTCIFDRHCVLFWIFYVLHNVLLICHFDVTDNVFVLILPFGMWNVYFLFLFLLYITIVFSFASQVNCFHPLSLGLCSEPCLLQSGSLLYLILCLPLIYTLRTMCPLSFGVWRHFLDFVHNFCFNMCVFFMLLLRIWLIYNYELCFIDKFKLLNTWSYK
jgi:hypothetical protein